MSQKLSDKPARPLLIAFGAARAIAVASNATTPGVFVPPPANKRAADTAREQTRQDIYLNYLNEGVQRWGLNE